MSNKTVQLWHVQLRILLCASVVVIEFVTALNAPNLNNHVVAQQRGGGADESNVMIGKDYDRYASKYFVSENETYASDKRIIVEDYFRQSALAPKNSVPTETPYANNVNTSMSSTNVNQEDNELDEVSGKRDKHSVTDEDLLSINSTPIQTLWAGNLTEYAPVGHRKDDKWQDEALLSRLLSNSSSSTLPMLASKNNYSRKGYSPYHGQKAFGKFKKTDTPMLNLVYDSYIKLRHPDFRLGTHFVGVAVGSLINVTIKAGQTPSLDCKINLLQDKTVSWVRRIFYFDDYNETAQAHQERQELQILTVGLNTFVADKRYGIDFQYPNNHRLQIKNVKKRDEGFYECQISTHPPKVIQYYLEVRAPELYIADENQHPLYERHYEVNSTLELYCFVNNINIESMSHVITWNHNDHVLNYDAIRGGVSVRTDFSEEGANSTLSVAHINKSDSGNYTCSVGQILSFTTYVHVLNESFAELFYHGCSVSQTRNNTLNSVLMLAFLLITLNKLLNCLPSPSCMSVR